MGVNCHSFWETLQALLFLIFFSAQPGKKECVVEFLAKEFKISTVKISPRENFAQMVQDNAIATTRTCK